MGHRQFHSGVNWLKAEIKGSLEILQTANYGHKGQVPHSPKPKDG